MDKKLVDLEYIDDDYIDSIYNLFLTFETENINYAPCCYLSEDDYWIDLLVLSSNNSQCISLKKDSIISFGFYTTESETVSQNQDVIAESYYQ